MAEFIAGLKLSEAFYVEAVAPLLARELPGLRHSAACIGHGSEVLGFDTEMSTDHDWGPRVTLFVGDADHAAHRNDVLGLFDRELPAEFRGWATRFGEPARHHVQFTTLERFVQRHLGFDLLLEIEPADWLSFPEQRLAGLTAGAVFRDDVDLKAVRARFAYYPRDVWLYLMACTWQRVAQEEHLAPRAGFVGDELGAGLIYQRLVGDVMRLAFLQARRYAPYAKWFGTAFRRLPCADELSPLLRDVQNATSWTASEAPLCDALEILAAAHNALGVTDPIPTATARFHDRPFRILHAERFASALLGKLEDPVVREIANGPRIGGLDQLSDNTDLKEAVRPLRSRLRTLWS